MGALSDNLLYAECINCETNHTDIWSLGVIIANMVFGHNPWRVATSSDSGFLEYLHNVDFQNPSHFTTFRRYRIFLIQPFARVSLPELRDPEILKLGLFLHE
jgi:serine/threonine protein kinase